MHFPQGKSCLAPPLIGASFGACLAPPLFGAIVWRLFGAFGARASSGACLAPEPIERRLEPNNLEWEALQLVDTTHCVGTLGMGTLGMGQRAHCVGTLGMGIGGGGMRHRSAHPQHII